MNLIEPIIGSLILGILCSISGTMLFNINKKPCFIKQLLGIIVFTVLSTIANIYATDMIKIIIKIIMTYILLCSFYKIIYKKSLSESIIGGFITYLIIFISEGIVAILLSMILEVYGSSSMLLFKNTIFINIIIYTLAYAILFISRKKLIQLINNNDFNIKSSSIIIFIMILTIALLGIRIPLTDWKFNIDFIVTMLILLFFCIIGFFLLKQKETIKKTTSMYQQVVEYSDITNVLLEDYRVVSHEHKNQLSIIRGMVDGNNQELIDYVDNLLEKREIIKYQWIGELNRLPLSGLKGLINYKLIEIESQELISNISISKDVTKTKLNSLTTKQKDNLYSIIGVYLDNAIQAAKKSKKKEISLEIYKEKKDIVIILANTYSGKIDLDKIDDYGYTTKGKNHGVGLHIVKRILEEDKIFTQIRSLFQDYFVQELRIHLNEIGK